MKKILFSIALMLGGLAFANAQIPVENPAKTSNEVVAQESGYKVVTLADLNAMQQTAIKNLAGETYDIKQVEYDAEKGLAKVALVNKEDQSQKSVIIDKQGNEQK